MKCIWIVGMNKTDQARLLERAKHAGASIVCIRSSNKTLLAAIDQFHDANIKVYAWRWPAVKPQPHSSTHYYAPDEAEFVADKLLPAGLDGYIVDPESDPGSDSNNWNKATLAPLARDFCAAIKNAAKKAKLADFHFGVTSGCSYPSPHGKPNIPWAEFVAASDALYPQTYWRWKNPETGAIEDINGGSPAASIKRGLAAWGPISTGKPIIPMAGELDHITAAEIGSYATLAHDHASAVHFYAESANVSSPIIDAIAAI